MDCTIAKDGALPPVQVAEQSSRSRVLEAVDVPVCGVEATLTSGRRYEVAAGPEGDRLTVRGRNGAVLLHVRVTDAGPVLAFESAELEITAARKLTLSAQEVAVEAGRALHLGSGGDCTQRVVGSRHTSVGGVERVEAGAVQVQANEGAAELRAAGRIALDGEHIGLNDDPCPQPFAWSAIARDEEGAGQS